jgi:ABC-type multidrug transport system fused ATPase/permease subunit
MALREDLFREILSKDCEFFDARKTGDLLSRLSADTSKIENALASQVSILIKSMLYTLAVFGMFFYISWKMALFTFAVMTPTLFAGPIYGKFMRKIMKEISDGKAGASNVAEEAFSNIRTVKAFATEDRECLAYAQKNDYIYSKAACQAMGYGAFSFFMQLCMFGSLDALIYFAAVLVLDGELSIGDFTSFQFYMFSFLINFMTMASVVGEVMGVIGTTSAIAEIFLHE